MIIEFSLNPILEWDNAGLLRVIYIDNLVVRYEWNPCLTEYVWSKPELDQKEKQTKKLQMYLRRYERRNTK